MLEQKFDFSTATLKDVPLVVRTIQALRKLAKDSQIKTTHTQSLILRTVPAHVLAAVALELSETDPELASVRTPADTGGAR